MREVVLFVMILKIKFDIIYYIVLRFDKFRQTNNKQKVII